MAQFNQENLPSYQGSIKSEISEYVGEQTLSMSSYHMIPKYTFNI